MSLTVLLSICSGVSRISFRGWGGGEVQAIFGKVGIFAWSKEQACSAWHSYAFARGFEGIWCVLENILLKFCQNKL